MRRFVCAILCAAVVWCAAPCRGGEPERIDLPTVLRLAGAQNLDVKLAEEKLKEARAVEDATLLQFFPWVSPGFGYRAHGGRLQDVQGQILSTDKQAYSVGPAVIAQVDLGDAIYKRLVAKQLTRAADHAVEAQKQQSILAAAEAYFELTKAHASVRVGGESVEVSREIQDQIARGVQAGVAFKGDDLRAQAQMKRNELFVIQAQDQRRVAAARLSEVLHLDSTVALLPIDSNVLPLNLAPRENRLDSLIAEALANRPELKQNAALADAAKANARGAKYGPLVPTVGAQVFAGGFGGGQNGNVGHFGGTEDYQVTIGWRIGPGGLFDRTRTRQAESKTAQAEIGLAKTRDDVIRQVVENHERVKLLRKELEVAKQALSAAQEALKLARERKEFAVGVVLETLQSEEDVTRAKLDYVNTIIELNKAQYRLKAALGR